MEQIEILLRNKLLFDFQDIDTRQRKKDVHLLLKSNRLNYLIRRLTKSEKEFIRNHSQLNFDYEMTHMICHLGFNNKLRKIPINMNDFDQFTISKLLDAKTQEIDIENRQAILSILYMESLNQLSKIDQYSKLGITNHEIAMRVMNLMCMGAKQ